jgi:hypothetical protein
MSQELSIFFYFADEVIKLSSDERKSFEDFTECLSLRDDGDLVTRL